MAGNAAEWVNDYFDFGYYTYAPAHNPAGPNQVLDHGLRGGCWASPHSHTQTFFRDSSHSVRPNPRVGFRCAQSLPKESDESLKSLVAANDGQRRNGNDAPIY
jgi:formylglycine-generating enzyme required for sulfatase activity